MIGIFGGTFDPVHFGHLRSALEVQELFRLDEVRLIPSSVPPHRQQPKASAEQRLAMLELAVAHRRGFKVDTRELDRPGNSYTVDTLASLRADFPEQTLLLFIGCDAYNGLTSWHRWRDLFHWSHVVVLTRPGFSVDEQSPFFSTRMTTDYTQLLDFPAGKLFFQAVTQLDISATAIRNRIAQQRDPSFLLPDAVLEYINDNNLYGH